MYEIRLAALVATIALYCVWLAPVHAQSAAGGTGAVISEGEAYLSGPVQMISSSYAQWVKVNTEGRYALILHQETGLPPASYVSPAPISVNLLLYDARTRKTKTLWEQQMVGSVSEVTVNAYWLPGTDCAVFTANIHTKEQTEKGTPVSVGQLFFLDLAKGSTARVLYNGPKSVDVDVSPRKPLAFLKIYAGYDDADKEQVRYITRQGILGASRALGKYRVDSGWNAEGTAAFFAESIPNPSDPGKNKVHYFEWSPETGAETPLTARPPTASPLPTPAPLSLRLVTEARSTAPPPGKATFPFTIAPLYLEATDVVTTPPDTLNRRIRIAATAGESWLLPDKSAVLYRADGALYAVPLVRLKATAFSEAQKASYQAAALFRATQIGNAIYWYATSGDRLLPPQAGFAEAIKENLGNPEFVKDFTYIGGGPPPSQGLWKTTIVGYYAGTGGRAVVYLDGHVKWEATP